MKPARNEYRPPVIRQITIGIDERVHNKLAIMAKKAGMDVTGYAEVLLSAAYAARCGVKDDPDLADAVAGTILLFGGGLDTCAAAKTLQLPESQVASILASWRDGRARAAA